MNDSIIFDQSTVALLMQCADPVVIAVSGGPDSMCLATLIRDFWLEQGKSLTDIHVAHYHHGLRVQSDDERDLVMRYCHDMIVHVGYYQGASSTERDLRIARHAFFQSVMKETGSTILILGHNLTDRIETSLMNMKRGCQVRGFLNMSLIESEKSDKIRKIGEIKSGVSVSSTEDNLTRHSSLVTRYCILRPFLNYPKQEIQAYCDEHQIPYMIDQSNFDTTVSARNKIRSEIVMKMTNQELQARRELYARLEAGQAHYDDPVRDDEMQGRCVGKVGEWSLDYLAYVFDWSGCYADMTLGRLLEWQQWIAGSFSGEKFVGGWRWWIKGKKVYLLPTY